MQPTIRSATESTVHPTHLERSATKRMPILAQDPQEEGSNPVTNDGDVGATPEVVSYLEETATAAEHNIDVQENTNLSIPVNAESRPVDTDDVKDQEPAERFWDARSVSGSSIASSEGYTSGDSKRSKGKRFQSANVGTRASRRQIEKRRPDVAGLGDPLVALDVRTGKVAPVESRRGTGNTASSASASSAGEDNSTVQSLSVVRTVKRRRKENPFVKVLYQVQNTGNRIGKLFAR